MKMNKISVKFLIAGAIFFLSVFALPDSAMTGGWYVRGAVGYEKSRTANMSDVNCSSISPPALFGCAAGDDGLPISAYGDFGNFPLVEAALGRQLLPWLRVDLALTYRFHMNYDGNANFLSVGSNQPVSAKADSLAGMLNVFVDINGFLPGKKLWRFQPYLGGGVGLAYNRLGEMTFLFPDNQGAHKISIMPAGDRTNFAYMLAVGTGVVLTEHFSLDIAYRYFDLGRVGSSPGNMYMDIIPAGIAVNDIESPLRTHGLAVGLRYHF